MLLLISDANILIDLESAGLITTLFQLPMTFAMPDILYYEEIEPGTPGLNLMGLKVMEVSGEFVRYAASLPARYNPTLPANTGHKPSHNDYLALALAKQEKCDLLTGDANLRKVAEREAVKVMGTVWLLCQMVEHHVLTTDDALSALERMKASGRRLPWSAAEAALHRQYALRHPRMPKQAPAHRKANHSEIPNSCPR